MSKIKILFVAANPSDRGRLALDKEHREIEAEIRAATHHDCVDVIFAGATRADDLLRRLNEHRPHVVHFSGHGGPSEILLVGEDDKAQPASREALIYLFGALKDNIRLVFLNACYSSRQAEAITKIVDCAIGMSQQVGDTTAIRFAAAFYRAIAYGRDLQNAFDQGLAAIQLEGLPAEHVPRLLCRSDVDPAEIVLVRADASGERAPTRRPLEHEDFLAAKFTGREQELADLEHEVREQLAAGTTLAFWGFRGTGGVGKSALTAQLADRLAADPLLFPGGVLWVDFVKYNEQPHEAAARWLRAYQPELDTSQLAQHECISRFRELARQRRPLIVLDNVQGLEQVEPLLVRAPGVATLITTRDLRNIPADVVSRTVEQLTTDDALNLLRTFAEEQVAAEPRAARRICEQCGHLPVFLKAAGAACRGRRYHSLSQYAQELARRGLASLADHDHKAAIVFDLSWEPLTPAEREAAVVLSQYPGVDFGANVLSAWFGIDAQAAWGMLVALEENAALIVPCGEERFRMHDRVRDYVESKLGQEDELISQAEVREGLLSCWTFWDMVRSEFDAVGAYELARQYHTLECGDLSPLSFSHDVPTERTVEPNNKPPIPGARVSGGLPGTPKESGDKSPHSKDPHSKDAHSKDFDAWYHFIRGQTDVLARWPELFFQQAYNQPQGSPVARAAQRAAAAGKAPPQWLEWTNRQVQYVPPACLQVLSGHEEVVSEVAWHGNPRYVVSSSWDETVRVWDLDSGECAFVLQAGSPASSVAVTAAGRIVAGGVDGLIRVWDLKLDGDSPPPCPALLRGHTAAVQCVAASGRGERLVSGGFDDTVRVWDLEDGRCTATFAMFEERASDVMSVAISRDGQRVVCGLLNGTLLAWDLSTQRCLAVMRGHAAGVQSVALSGDGRRAVSGSWDKSIRLWDMETGTCLAALRGHYTHAVSIAMTADGRLAVSGSWGQTVRVWDLVNRECLAILEGHTANVAGVALSPDETRVVSGSFDHTVRVWDLRHALGTGRLVHGEALELTPPGEDELEPPRDDDGVCSAPESLPIFPGGRHASYISRVGFISDGFCAVSCSGDETLRVWHVDTGACLDTQPVDSAAAKNMLACLQGDGPHRALVDPDAVVLRDAETGDLIARFPGQFTTAACSPDGQAVIAGTGNGRVVLLQLKESLEFTL